MPKIPIIKSKDMLNYLLKFNCKLINTKGSHHRILNTLNNKLSTIPVHNNKDLAPGLFVKILKDLDIDIEEFIKFIK